MTRFVAYLRVSTDEQARSGTSPQTQRDDCLAYVKRMGGHLVAVCEDMGVSGTRYQTRPGIQEALRVIESGQANTLLATKIDRIGRNAKVVLEIAERVDAAGGRLVTTDGMELGGSPIGKMLLTTMAAVAELERGMIRERTMTGLQKMAESGKQPKRARRPFGYNLVGKADVLAGRYPAARLGEYEPHPEEAPIARQMFERYAAGASLNGLSAWLFGQGIKTTVGNARWGRKTIRQILMNGVYKGEAAYGKTELRRRETDGQLRYTTKYVAPEKWTTWSVPPLVSEELWDVVQDRLKRATAELSGRPDRKYLLSGIVRCPHCGYGMACTMRIDGPTGTRNAYLFCSRARRGKNVGGPLCDYHSIHKAKPMELLVLRGVEEFATRPEMISGAIEAYRQRSNLHMRESVEVERERYEEQLRRIRSKERAALELQVAAVENELDPASYTNMLREIAADRKRIEERLAGLDRTAQVDIGASLMDGAAVMREAALKLHRVLYSDALPVAQKHDLLTMLIQAITPGKHEIDLQLRALWIAGSKLGVETVPLMSEKSLE